MAKGVFDALLHERYKNPAQYLTPRVQYFCRFYAVHCNGQQAAIEAGYKESKARDCAQQLLKNEYVLAYINELSASLFDKLGMTRAWLARHYKNIIDQDIAELYDKDGCLKPLDKMPLHVRQRIARIETKELFEGKGKDRKRIGRSVEVYQYDKLKAMDAVRTMAGYNEEKAGININNSNVQMNFNNIQIIEVVLNL